MMSTVRFNAKYQNHVQYILKKHANLPGSCIVWIYGIVMTLLSSV